MSDLIKAWPCESCESCGSEYGTGASYCKASLTGDRECADYLEARFVDEELAPQAAALIRRVNDADKRRELAIATADGFANMLDLQHRGTEFDTDAFLRSCNAHVLAGVA